MRDLAVDLPEDRFKIRGKLRRLLPLEAGKEDVGGDGTEVGMVTDRHLVDHEVLVVKHLVGSIAVVADASSEVLRRGRRGRLIAVSARGEEDGARKRHDDQDSKDRAHLALHGLLAGLEKTRCL